MIIPLYERPAGNIIMLSQRHVERALTDFGFTAMLPEFAELKAKYSNKNTVTRSNRGCRGCGSARMSVSFFNEFLGIARSLPEERKVMLRSYFGAKEITTNTYDTATGTVRLVKL